MSVGEDETGGRVARGPVGIGIPDKVVGWRVLVAQAHGFVMMKVDEDASRSVHKGRSRTTHSPTQ
eukprot:2169628-Pleurochrysis_carterae.AAC.1